MSVANRVGARMRLTVLVFLIGMTAASAQPATDHFEKKVRPLLIEKCISCHGPEKQKGGLRLDSRAGLLTGGDRGAAVVPSKPGESLLMHTLAHDGEVKMPPKNKLSATEIAAVREWVQAGAPWPNSETTQAKAPPISKAAPREFTPEERKYWAFQPVTRPIAPAVRDAEGSVRNDIDRFLLAKLQEKGLSFAAPADKRTLIRRVTFDLTGLPPTPAEIEAFVKDSSPKAYENLVERLLASPGYGEKWGRRWLDIARYADSNGMDENLAYINAWRYRDWVIKSFNADTPYDQFIREQIAGDLIMGGSEAERAERMTATGFLVIGPKMLAEDDPMKMRMDIIDEQLDTLGQAVMGMTFGCARCHDHKFDPLTQADYYGLAGIFYSTKTMKTLNVVATWNERTLGTPKEIAALAEHEKKLAVAKSALTKAEKAQKANVGTRVAEEKKRAVDYASAASAIHAPQGSSKRPPMEDVKTLPEGRGLSSSPESVAIERKLVTAFVRQWVEVIKKREGKVPTGDELRKLAEAVDGPFRLSPAVEKEIQAAIKAEVEKLREQLAAVQKTRPAVDEVMAVDESKPENLKIHLRGNHLTLGDETPRQFPRIMSGAANSPLGSDRSGRLELAKWMTRPEHPLTARVMANRIWAGHFGEGLVRSPDNFGKLGERPTHPDLLDWLASEFVRSNWSVKEMHRLILGSTAYRMSSAGDAKVAEMDPENKLYSHFNRRRLGAEEVRDGMLAVASMLDRSMYGTLLKFNPRQYVTSTVSKRFESYESPRRSVYLPIIRSGVYDVLQTLDFPDPSVPNGRRNTSTIPTQALLLLNSSLADETSESLAASILKEKSDDAARVDEAYLRTMGRSPTTAETEKVLAYLKKSEAIADPNLGSDPRRLVAWRGLCRVLLASNEFLFVE